jgi:hypothetical protein
MTATILHANDAAHALACGHVLAADTALVLSETGSANLIDLSGAIHALTPVAADMVRLTLETGREAAVAALVERYDAPAEQIAADLDTLWNDLGGRGLIVRAEDANLARPTSPTATALAWLTDRVLAAPLPLTLRTACVLAFVRWSCGRAGLSATIEAWRRRFGTGGVVDADAVADEARLVHSVATRMWLRVDCKERALTSWTMARRKGIDATVVIGVKAWPLGGHAWCRIGDRIVSDDADFCAAHDTVFEFGRA